MKLDYEAMKLSYKYVQSELEADFPDKSFVSPQVNTKAMNTRFDAIQNGNKHFFLILQQCHSVYDCLWKLSEAQNTWRVHVQGNTSELLQGSTQRIYYYYKTMRNLQSYQCECSPHKMNLTHQKNMG